MYLRRTDYIERLFDQRAEQPRAFFLKYLSLKLYSLASLKEKPSEVTITFRFLALIFLRPPVDA